MTLNAIKDGVGTIGAATINPLLSLQPFTIIYEGTLIDSKTGAGVTENDVMTNNYAIRFTATGVSAASRAELKIAADGSGQDLTLLVKGTDFNPNGSSEGTTLASITVPKEFLPATAAYWSIPLNVSGLTPGSKYWLIVQKVGDATNHFHLVGEASQDAAHPCYYRAGTSGAWTANNAIHFKVYSGKTGEIIHCIEGTNKVETYTYDGDYIDKIYRYLPPSDGAAGGVREIMTLTWSGDYLLSGGVV